MTTRKTEPRTRKPDSPLSREEPDGVEGIDRREDPRRVEDVRDAEDREDDEPDEHDRPEDGADPAGPLLWNEEEPDEDDDGDRHDVRLEAGVATSSPSTAESTEIAGVMIPSP